MKWVCVVESRLLLPSQRRKHPAVAVRAAQDILDRNSLLGHRRGHTAATVSPNSKLQQTIIVKPFGLSCVRPALEYHSLIQYRRCMECGMLSTNEWHEYQVRRAQSATILGRKSILAGLVEWLF